MKIAILPYEHRPEDGMARVPLKALRWPLGSSETSGTVGDLGPDDHLIIYPRSKYFVDPRSGVTCKISLLITEPYAVQRRNYLYAIALQRRFHRIVTHRPAMARWAGNALVMPFGGAWVDTENLGAVDKSCNMSLIASTKTKLEGHALRHRIATWSNDTGRDVDLLGLAYRRIERKEDGLLPYRYSVVIENSREEGYFTEKLVDSLLCDALPIYWGAQDIERFFDPEGLIICQSGGDIEQAIINATPQLYEQKYSALVRNRERALAYLDYEKNAAEKLVNTARPNPQTSVS
ncbi:MAG: hypothetical protein GY789_29685 [Hyphomicrobiales bacterium]|nr:hypothetical protein [Hyphomicrobiales bacterium]MCP5000258.1 hypothetical protein [Hyphomicrobiales bacterium]